MKPKELVREKLEKELADIWNRQLIIVAAPSGYGKTTLIRGFLQNFNQILSVWIALGQEEVDDVLVWKKLCDRLMDINERFAETLRTLGLPRNGQQLDYIIELIYKEVDSEVCLILDDFQECNSEDLNRFLVRMVSENMSNIHIIMITRVYPDIPYEEMVLRGQCGTIDQLMLSLSMEETKEVFLINGLVLTEDELNRIYEYTDGWISAVYLALFEYQRSGRLGRFLSASHLLKTSIFEKLNPDMQDLFMKMSLFESFTLEEAVFIAQSNVHPMSLIEAMEQFGFMQFDIITKRFQMHSLLRTVAVGELERLKIDKQQLFNRGGDWCERNGDYIQAVINYRNANNLEAVLRLYSSEVRNIIFEEAPAIAKEIFREIPLEVRANHPTAWLSHIYFMLLRDNPEYGVKIYHEAREAYIQMYQLDQEDTRHKELRGEMLIIRALIEFNDLEVINAKLSEAYELLHHRASRIFRQSVLTYGSPFMTLLYYRKSGELKRTIELEKEYAHYHMLLVGGGDNSWDDLFDAEYAMLKGDMQYAYQLAKQLYEKASIRKQWCIIVSSYYLQLRCMIYFGLKQEFNAKMKELKEFVKKLARPILVVDAQLTYSYAYACLGNKEEMADWICNFDLDNCNRIIRNTRCGCITYGMLLCKTGQWAQLDMIADKSMIPYDKTTHIYAILRGYIYKAIATYHLSSLEKARSYLRKAIEIAEPDEVRIPFIENNEELQPIFDSMEIKGKFYQSLKPHFKQYNKSIKVFQKGEAKIMLTQREKELMGFVKAGLRNSEISQKMNIALVTVEKNLTTIYRKLNVSNRAAAIARINELNRS